MPRKLPPSYDELWGGPYSANLPWKSPPPWFALMRIPHLRLNCMRFRHRLVDSQPWDSQCEHITHERLWMLRRPQSLLQSRGCHHCRWKSRSSLSLSLFLSLWDFQRGLCRALGWSRSCLNYKPVSKQSSKALARKWQRKKQHIIPQYVLMSYIGVKLRSYLQCRNSR